MPLPVARVGDKAIGTCFCHSPPIPMQGTIITGSTDTYCNNLPVARLGDRILADCGHEATIITASQVDYANNLGIARVGDLGTGCFVCTIITGSVDTFSG